VRSSHRCQIWRSRKVACRARRRSPHLPRPLPRAGSPLLVPAFSGPEEGFGGASETEDYGLIQAWVEQALLREQLPQADESAFADEARSLRGKSPQDGHAQHDGHGRDGHGHHDGRKAEPVVTLKRKEVPVDPEGNMTKDGVELKMCADDMNITMQAIDIKGGLLQSFSLNGHNILLVRPHLDQMDGSIFWPSPQKDWGWPPPLAIDPTVHKNFTIKHDLALDLESKTFELTSPVWEERNLTLAKKVSVDTSRKSFIIDYSMRMSGGSTGKFAPWEISRVQAGGLTFFKTGSNETSGTWKPLRLKKIDGVTWFQQKGDVGQGKLYASTTPSRPDSPMAWLAHTDGKVVFVKCFYWLPDGTNAPEENQVEIYDGEDYVEMEQQGAYQTVFPGQPISWRVEWFLRAMPEGAKAKPGDKTLVEFADDLCH